jgi:hypothetical protein
MLVGAAETWEGIMRIATPSITAMLAVGLAFPAAAAAKKSTVVSEAHFQSFYVCEKKALDMGLVHGEDGHREFVRECMGMRPSSPASERR